RRTGTPVGCIRTSPPIPTPSSGRSRESGEQNFKSQAQFASPRAFAAHEQQDADGQDKPGHGGLKMRARARDRRSFRAANLSMFTSLQHRIDISYSGIRY